MRTLFSPALRPLWLAALLAGAALSAQARGNWSVDLNIGLPIGPSYYGGPVYAAPGYGGYLTALPAGSVSVTVGGGRYWRHGDHWYRPWGPRWVIVAPPIVLGQPEPVYIQHAAPPPLPAAPAKPDPIIYPRQGQSAEQAEADRRDCNRWATTQPAAMAEATVFHRAVEACMDGRGYTLR